MTTVTNGARKTTADLYRAVKAYCARLPFMQAVIFAAGVWGVSEEEAVRRLKENEPSLAIFAS